MLAIERKQEIYDLIKKNHKVVVSELSLQLNVTEETIRRDLKELESRGLVTRSHGGAILREERMPNLPFTEREVINFEAKSIIAHIAQELIKDGMTIMVDTSTTAKFIVSGIDSNKKVTIITNSYMLINELSTKSNLRIIATGGECFVRYKAYVGRDAINTIHQYNADLGILGCNALAKDRGLVESNAEESDVKLAMAEHSLKTLICADHSKFDKYSTINTLKFNELDYFVTDVRPDQSWLDLFNKFNIKALFDESSNTEGYGD